MKAVYPDIHDEIHAEIFASYDKNGDGWLCGKPQPHAGYNTVDNTSNHGSGRLSPATHRGR